MTTPIAPTSTPGAAYGHDLSAMTSKGSASGGTEFPGSRRFTSALPYNTPTTDIPDLTGGNSGAGGEAWYLTLNDSVWFGPGPGGTAPAWGMALKEHKGTCPSAAVAADSQIVPPSGPNSYGFNIGTVYQANGQALTHRNLAMLFVLDLPFRGVDFNNSESNTDNYCAICDHGLGTLIFCVNQDNCLCVRYGGTQYTSALRLFAGRNAIFLQTDATGCTITTYHQGSERLNFAIGTGSHATRNLGTAGAGGKALNAFFRYDHFFSSGTQSAGDVASVLEWCAQTYGLVPHKHLLVAVGDSYLNGYYDVPGSSVLSRFANANPTWRVLNLSKSGAAMDTAISVTQLGRAVSAISLLSGMPASARAFALVQGTANDLAAGRTAAQIKTDFDTTVDGLAAVYHKVLVVTPLQNAQVNASDATIAARETIVRDVAAYLRAGCGGRIPTSHVIDNNLLVDTGTGTAADVKTALRASTYFRTYNDYSDFVADSPLTGMDGLHGGVYFQEAFGTAIGATITPLLPADVGPSARARSRSRSR